MRSATKKELFSLTAVSVMGLAFFGTAKLLSRGETVPETPIVVEAPLRGCFTTLENAVGSITSDNSIYYTKVWGEKVFEWHGLILKNVKNLKAAEDIHFSGKYLDLDEKGCAIPKTTPQQVGRATRNSTADYNFELISWEDSKGIHYPKTKTANIRKATK